jgi:hypothetical protein
LGYDYEIDVLDFVERDNVGDSHAEIVDGIEQMRKRNGGSVNITFEDAENYYGLPPQIDKRTVKSKTTK